MTADELSAWQEKHKLDCCINFDGSSKAMESEAARRIWGCSVAKHNFRYIKMLSDGDSTAFKAVKAIKCYGSTVYSNNKT